MGNRNEGDVVFDHAVHFFQVFFILLRDKDGFDTIAVGCHRFFLQSANRKNSSAQSDLAGHSDIMAYRNLS